MLYLYLQSVYCHLHYLWLIYGYIYKQEINIMLISEKIKLLRQDNRLTQKELALKLHVSAQAVSNWELNKGFPDISNLIMLSDLFDITLDSLIKEDADMKEQLLQDKASKNINLIFSTIALTVCLVIFGYAMHNVITSHFNELHVMGLTVGILGTFSFGFELKKYLGK